MAPRALLRRGIEKAAGTHQEAARRVNYSKEMMSKVLAGERNIAPDVAGKLSGMHLIAGLAIAQELTGYLWFRYIDGDRHPQNLLQRALKEDHEADILINQAGARLIDKAGPEDLTPEDMTFLQAAAKELSDEITASINLLIELEDRYKLGLLGYLTGQKEKTQAVAEARASYNF